MTIAMGSHDLILHPGLVVTVCFVLACVLAHYLRTPLRDLAASWQGEARPAPQSIAPPRLPDCLARAWKDVADALGQLFRRGNGAALVATLVAVPISVLDYFVNLFAVKIAFPGETKLAGFAAAGLYLSLVSVAARLHDTAEPSKWVSRAFAGLVLVATGLGGYATYFVCIAQRFDPATTLGATALGGALRLFVSLAAAWAGARCHQTPFVRDLVLVLVAATLLVPLTLVVGTLIVVWFLLCGSWRLLTLWLPRIARLVFVTMAEIGRLLTLRWTRREGPHPKLEVHHPVPCLYVERSIRVAGRSPTSRQVHCLLGKRKTRYALGTVDVQDGSFDAVLPLNGNEARVSGRCFLFVTDNRTNVRIPLVVRAPEPAKRSARPSRAPAPSQSSRQWWRLRREFTRPSAGQPLPDLTGLSDNESASRPPSLTSHSAFSKEVPNARQMPS